MKIKRAKIGDEKLLELYRGLLKPRLIEEKMLILLRQGRISKWFSGIGQEASPVGVTMALNKDDVILPMHRHLGVFTSRNIPLYKLFRQFRGDDDGFTKGRDRSFHFGSLEHNIVGMISHLGAQLGVADGFALSSLLQNDQKVTAVFSGDGGSSQGDFHEAINVAAVWSLPLIIVVENNGYGLSTPSKEQFIFESFVEKGPGYGIEAYSVDGNNVAKVYHTVKKIANSIRKEPRPILLECKTFRMRGHEEASGTKYVPKELMEEWAAKDPLENFERALLEREIISDTEIANLRASFKNDIQEAVDRAFLSEVDNPNSGNEMVSSEREYNDVYKEFNFTPTYPSHKLKNLRFCDAITEALDQAMHKHNNLILMGQDIAEYGGVFKITEGLMDRYGKSRVRNTPLCESAILGAALGLSMSGYKSMVEMQFSDFVSCGFNQIVNNIAKIHYRWGPNADVVIRMPAGAGVGAGPFHSQSMEAWFMHVPGLKILYPSNSRDAKGLLLTAFEDPNPVLFFEHKALYRSISDDVPMDYFTIPMGKAVTTNQGNEISVITYGMGVHWLLEIIKDHPEFSIDLIDLRSIQPWDKEAVEASVKKTGKVLVVHEASLTAGCGAEIASWIAEHLFENLDAPVMRHGALDTPVPFAKRLEDQYLGKKELLIKLQALLDF